MEKRCWQRGQQASGASGRVSTTLTGNQVWQRPHSAQSALPRFSQAAPGLSRTRVAMRQILGQEADATPASNARARSRFAFGTVATDGTARGAPGRGGGGSVASTPSLEAV